MIPASSTTRSVPEQAPAARALGTLSHSTQQEVCLTNPLGWQLMHACMLLLGILLLQ
jgi:hypothetical protein